MSWIIEGDLDEEITAIRNHWERVTGKTISKKDLIKKLIYENETARKVIETQGMRIKKNVIKLPKLDYPTIKT